MKKIEVPDTMSPHRTPAVSLIPTEDAGVSGCWFGGGAKFPENIAWPMHCMGDGFEPVPMHFLAQLDLSQIPQLEGFDYVPDRGHLLFFFNAVYAPGGADLEDASKVIYIDDDVSHLSYRYPPAMPETIEIMTSLGYRENSKSSFEFCALDLEVIDTYPSPAGQSHMVHA